MKGFHFTKFDPNEDGRSKFDQLLDLFMQLLTYTSGDVGEALQWMNQLDREYQLTNEEYGMGDFVDDLKDKGYITENEDRAEIKITPKTEQGIRKKSLEEIFGKLKKTKSGDHQTYKPGQGDEGSLIYMVEGFQKKCVEVSLIDGLISSLSGRLEMVDTLG